MGLSNYVPNSRISQAGVCTSTTRPASPYEGQVIYETDTNRVLVWEGSAWVAPNSQTANPPGLERIVSGITATGGTVSDGIVTINSGVTTVSVNSCFSSNYDDYLILYSGISFSIGAGGSSFFMRFNNSTGNTYEYGGSWRGIINTGFSGTQATSSGNGIWTALTGGNSSDSFGKITIYNPNKTSRTAMLGEAINSGYSMVTGGADTNPASQTGFNFFLPSASGTMTGGTIRVYGYRN